MQYKDDDICYTSLSFFLVKKSFVIISSVSLCKTSTHTNQCYTNNVNFPLVILLHKNFFWQS